MIPQRLREALLGTDEEDDLASLLLLDCRSQTFRPLVDAGDGVGVGLEETDLRHVEQEMLSRRPTNRVGNVNREANGAAGKELGGGETGRREETG
jgi:hypothetical protein